MTDLTTILLAVIAATGASFVTAMATRPKTRADANAANAGAQVALSADAREWAAKFEERADKADAKAQAAHERADHAEDMADDCERRMTEVERKFDDVVRYLAVVLEQWGTPGPPPPMPLTLSSHVGLSPQPALPPPVRP